MSGAGVRLEIEGRLARLVLDRPPLNVLDIATLQSLSDALDAVRASRSLRVLAVSGAGKAFCAGVDVADHAPDRVGETLRLFHGVIRRVLSIEVPVVACVHGAALGGGCELAIACDVVLARDDARLGQPEIQLGVFPPVAAALLPRLIGRQRALDLILSGRTLGADEARVTGLVSQVWPADRFAAESTAYLERLAALSGPALRLAKRAANGSRGLPIAEGIARAEELYLGELMALPDAREGIAAFLEKRSPVWQET